MTLQLAIGPCRSSSESCGVFPHSRAGAWTPGCRGRLPGPAFSDSVRVPVQLLRCPDVAAAADEEMIRTVADWFQREEPAVVKLLLRAVEILSRHENTVSWPHRGPGPAGPQGPRADGADPPRRVRPRQSP